MGRFLLKMDLFQVLSRMNLENFQGPRSNWKEQTKAPTATLMVDLHLKLLQGYIQFGLVT